MERFGAPLGFGAKEERVEAVPAAAERREEQEREAQDHGQLTVILDGPEATWRPCCMMMKGAMTRRAV